MDTLNLFKLFDISTDSDDNEVKESCKRLMNNLNLESEKEELLESFNKISTKEKRYLYFLTSTQGLKNISELDDEIISRPNYIGPRQWLELLE